MNHGRFLRYNIRGGLAKNGVTVHPYQKREYHSALKRRHGLNNVGGYGNGDWVREKKEKGRQGGRHWWGGERSDAGEFGGV